MTQPKAATAVEVPASPMWGEGVTAMPVLDFSSVPITGEQLVQSCADDGDPVLPGFALNSQEN